MDGMASIDRKKRRGLRSTSSLRQGFGEIPARGAICRYLLHRQGSRAGPDVLEPFRIAPQESRVRGGVPRIQLRDPLHANPPIALRLHLLLRPREVPAETVRLEMTPLPGSR